MENKLLIFGESAEPQKQHNPDKPRTATGRYATPRESNLLKREARINNKPNF